MHPLAVADRWFEVQRIDDVITMLVEPHVHPMVRCNIWHVRGRRMDLVIDTSRVGHERSVEVILASLPK